jgi:hypothetical protein
MTHVRPVCGNLTHMQGAVLQNNLDWVSLHNSSEQWQKLLPIPPSTFLWPILRRNRYLRPEQTNLSHACSKWHTEFTVVPILFYFFCPTSACVLWAICVYVHVSDCAETVYELPLLPNNTSVTLFYTNKERCSALTGYLSLGRRSGGDWANMWHWTKCFITFFSNKK